MIDRKKSTKTIVAVLLLVGLILVSGCIQENQSHELEDEASIKQQPNNFVEEREIPEVKDEIKKDNTTIKPTEQETKKDPVLARLSRTLLTEGMDCTFENFFDTRNSLAIDPTNPNILYVGIEGKGIYKSIDSGKTWKQSSSGILAYLDRNNPSQKCYTDMAEIIIDPTNTKRLLLAPADTSTGYIDWPYAETAGVWESLDGGESWHQLISGRVNAAGTGALAIDPNNPHVIYFGVNSDPPTFKEAPIKETLNKNGSLYKSTDGGKTWIDLEIGRPEAYLQTVSIFINPKNSQELILLTQAHDHFYGENYIDELFSYDQFGPMKSFDGGKTWIKLANNLPSPYRNPFDGDVSLQNFDHMIVRPFLFGADEFPPDVQQKSFYSFDRGETFKETPILIWVGRYDPQDPKGNHLLGYSPWYANGDIVESMDGGATWQPIGKPKEIDNTKVKVSNFVWDPKNQKTVYMTGTQGYVWKSDDGGQTWKTILNLDMLS